MSELSNLSCEAIQGDVSALDAAAVAKFAGQLTGWRVVEGHHLTKSYTFHDFAQPLAVLNHIAELAEREGHHPDLRLSWGRLEVDLWTHAARGLTKNDFILAAKIDALGEGTRT